MSASWYFEAKMWLLGVPIGIEGLLFLGSVRGSLGTQSTCTYTFTAVGQLLSHLPSIPMYTANSGGAEWFRGRMEAAGEAES